LDKSGRNAILEEKNMKLTDKEFLKKEIELAISPDNPEFVTLAELTVEQIKHLKNLKTIDFGAGVGVYSEQLRKAGFDVTPQDISKAHRDFIKKNYPDLNPVARPVKADLMIYIEVAEHQTDEEIIKTIEKISPKVILFSSTPHFSEIDTEWNHINIKSEDEWLNFFADLGYKKEKSLNYPTPWAMLLKKI